MKAKSTIEKEIRALQKIGGNMSVDEENRNMAYGAAQALRWALMDTGEHYRYFAPRFSFGGKQDA